MSRTAWSIVGGRPAGAGSAASRVPADWHRPGRHLPDRPGAEPAERQAGHRQHRDQGRDPARPASGAPERVTCGAGSATNGSPGADDTRGRYPGSLTASLYVVTIRAKLLRSGARWAGRMTSAGDDRARTAAPAAPAQYGRPMEEPARDVGLRRGVLAVSVLDDISLVPATDGILLATGPRPGDRRVHGAGQLGRARHRGRARSTPSPPPGGSGCATGCGSAPCSPSWAPRPPGGPSRRPCPWACRSTIRCTRAPPGSREHVLGGVLDLGVGIRGLIGDDPDHVSVLCARSWPEPSACAPTAGGRPCASGSRTWASSPSPGSSATARA